MELKQAVEVIKSNWPDERYTMLREALTVVLNYLPTSDNSDYAKCPSGKICKNWPSKCDNCLRNDMLKDHFA
jgi:hypothetical protein